VQNGREEFFSSGGNNVVQNAQIALKISHQNVSGGCRPLIYFFLMVSNNIVKSVPHLHSVGGEQDLYAIGTFFCSSGVSFVCTHTEFNPPSYRYNKADAVAVLPTACARSSYT